MHSQSPMTIDRGEEPNTAIAFSLVGFVACGGSVFVYRRWEGADELGEVFLSIALLGALFFFIGLSLLLWRSRVVLDRSAGTGLEWNGILVPMKRNAFRLDQVRQVSLTHAKIRGRYSSTTVYTARLEGLRKAVVLASDVKEASVRQTAEDAACYLGVPFSNEVIPQKGK